MKNNRTFGIELEFSSQNTYLFREKYQVMDLLSETKEPVILGSRTDKVKNWKLTQDGSVSGNGLELVSPILHGEEGLSSLKKIMKVLEGIAFVDRTAGQHVHVGAIDLTFQQRKLVALSANQKEYSDFFPRHRITGTYSSLFSQTEIDRMVAYQERENCPFNRGKFVNLQAYEKHGTIEFRGLEGNLDFDVSAAWIEIVTSLVEVAKKRTLKRKYSEEEFLKKKQTFLQIEEKSYANRVEALFFLVADQTEKEKQLLRELFLIASAPTPSEKIKTSILTEDWVRSLKNNLLSKDPFYGTIRELCPNIRFLLCFNYYLKNQVSFSVLSPIILPILKKFVESIEIEVLHIQGMMDIYCNEEKYDDLIKISDLNLTDETKKTYDMRTEIFKEE